MQNILCQSARWIAFAPKWTSSAKIQLNMYNVDFTISKEQLRQVIFLFILIKEQVHQVFDSLLILDKADIKLVISTITSFEFECNLCNV